VSDWPELLILAVQSLRLAWRRGRSRSWPTAPGTVQPAGVNRGWGFWAPAQYRSIFAYAFAANGSRYAGFFALEADREEDALAMQKQMTGTGVTVRYHPENPDVSILEDRQILGRRLTQNPHWVP
jgi:hypothetical protein